MTGAKIALAAGTLACGFAGAEFVAERDALTRQRAAIDAEWRDLGQGLLARSELLPAIVGAARARGANEPATFAALEAGRAALNAAKTPRETIAANSELDAALAHLFTVAENYPSLRGGTIVPESFLAADNRILRARRKYNEAVQKYNQRIALFPANLVGAVSGFRREDAYFTTGPVEKAVSTNRF